MYIKEMKKKIDGKYETKDEKKYRIKNLDRI